MRSERSQCANKISCSQETDCLEHDAAQIGAGFKKIATPKDQYPELVRAGIGLVRKQYEKAGIVVTDERVQTVLNFYLGTGTAE